MLRNRIDSGVRSRLLRLARVGSLSVAVALAAAGCSTWGGFAKPHAGQLRDRPEIRLGDASVKLHLARPASDGAAPRVLLLHVTGDAGWIGLDITYFERLASRGYTLVGVSARPLRAHLGAAGTPAKLAADYLTLIAEAESRLQLPRDTPVVLTGLSRGASLAVVAASQPELGRRIAGVLAMGLIARESSVEPPAAPYGLLDRLACPLVVLESTVDRHLRAEESRRLFGPDTPSRKLVAIEAKSHTFSGNRDEFFRQVEVALEWMTSVRRSPADKQQQH